MSRFILRRFAPLALAVAVSTFSVYRCTETPVGGGGGCDPEVSDCEQGCNPAVENCESEGPVQVITTGKTLDSLLKDGHNALKKEAYDAALEYYEAAYKKDGNNAKAITYSTLAKIASISIEPRVVNLFKNQIGFKDYPNKLNALLSKDWMTNYVEEGFDYSYPYCAGPDCEWFSDDWCSGSDCHYASWHDSWYVNNSDYPGVTKEGYYYEEHSGYTFGGNTPNYRDQIRWSYYDASDRWIRWFDQWDVQYYGLSNGVGYYYEQYNSNTGYSYVFVTSTPQYETYIDSYCERNKCYSWYDEDQINGGWYDGIDRVGYWSYDYTYHFVTSQKRDIRYYDNYLPTLVAAPNWVKGSGSWYNESLLESGASSIETYPLILFSNLLEKNTSGLNNLLDSAIAVVFGTAFNEAVTRTAKLKGKAAITLDREFIAALNLEDFADETDKIGWAEVNVLTSFMTGIKASLEWVASYDWNTNLNFMKFAWGSNMEDSLYNRLKTVSVSDLPFKNNFLKERSGKMAAAKADFVKAVTGLRDSYTDIRDNPMYPSEVNSAYPTLKQGADLLIAAINGSKVFYIPEDPTTGSWPTANGSKVVGGIDMGKLFQGGYFSLANLFEVSGGAPVFYVDGTKLTTSNYKAKINEAGYGALKFKASHVKAIVSGFDTDEVDNEVMLDIPDRFAILLFEKYNNLSLSKERIGPLAKASVRK